MNRKLLLFAVSVGICIGIALFLRDSTPTPTDPAPQPSAVTTQPVVAAPSDMVADNRPIEVLTAGFASASACMRCHQDEHHSWHASFHRTMTQTVTSKSAFPAIENTKVQVAGVEYQFVREGTDKYFVKFDDPIDASPEVVQKELVLMTGSHHMSVFWYESPFARTPAMLPIVYLRDQQRWIPRNAAFVRPPGYQGHELGRWNQVCCRCHSTHPRGRLDKQTDVWDTHVVDFGIACESCHGPGEKHIQFHDGLANVDPSADVVVSPENLPHHLRSDVCGQCHSVHLPDFDKYDIDKLMAEGLPFRPGDDFENSPLRTLVRESLATEGTTEFDRTREQLLQNSFWPDGTVRVAGREYNGLVDSPCYQDGEMSCLSCHEMHPDKSVDLETWRDDQLKPGMRTNHACTQCHQEATYNSDLASHTHHAADSHGSNCMNCHMPHTSYGLLKSVRSHRIESPSVLTTLTTGRPNGCMLCHLDRNIGWVAESLSKWYGQQELELKNPLARETASGLVNLLVGDAGLRAIYAATFAWEPAREASGTDWMAPYLALGLIDEYEAVRIITKRTLQTLPDVGSLEIDEFADMQARVEWVNRYLQNFKQNVTLEPRSELLIGEDGKIDFEKASQMFNSRDQTPIFLQE